VPCIGYHNRDIEEQASHIHMTLYIADYLNDNPFQNCDENETSHIGGHYEKTNMVNKGQYTLVLGSCFKLPLNSSHLYCYRSTFFSEINTDVHV